MKLIAVLTEKSLNASKVGKYTFWVDFGLTKNQVKRQVEQIFGVHVKSVRTINYRGRHEVNYRGKMRKIMPRKKAIVSIGEKEKIDLFEVESKKKK